MMQRKFRLMRYILAIFILWFLAHSVFIVFDGLQDKNENVDVAIVLGNKIEKNGKPSERLKARLDQSIKLYRENRVKNIIVSGGFGKEGIWEGNQMKEYLVENRIPAEKIIVDNFGNDTEKTVKNSIRIMDSLNFSSAMTVSQYFHQTRTKQLFRKNGFKNIESSSPQYFEIRDFYSIVREFFAYYTETL